MCAGNSTHGQATEETVERRFVVSRCLTPETRVMPAAKPLECLVRRSAGLEEVPRLGGKHLGVVIAGEKQQRTRHRTHHLEWTKCAQIGELHRPTATDVVPRQAET